MGAQAAFAMDPVIAEIGNHRGNQRPEADLNQGSADSGFADHLGTLAPFWFTGG
ncbi:hypothetical protein IZ6_17730 [Terrihabitans soli]|uniref:Uncharacterized protein n=1 Tax=Terrihabitans soli TaxID=708113 RepID=A0A6S6QWX4_9HYPH|nr:hypothetical protein IZ6_17730 [Terrihabitans soli]